MSGPLNAAASAAATQPPLSHMAANDTPDYMSWSPERLMREYAQQPMDGDVLVRLTEYYTNKELVLKINQKRL